VTLHKTTVKLKLVLDTEFIYPESFNIV